jgi:two-component system, chemotaxis family, chemotaxis protein CheY
MVSCLLIDRNAGERHKLSDLMAELGFDCTELPEAADAIRYCEMYRPDVVVMSAGSSDDALDFLRFAPGADSSDGRPVVIFYADTPDVETMGEAIREGAAEFLLKPFDRDLLKFKLRQSGVIPARAN